jgi:hypothetical protein
MPGKLKQTFAPNTRIRISATTSAELDGQYGTIIGITATDPSVDFYIVELDQPLASGWRAITLIESCIDKLSNQE